MAPTEALFFKDRKEWRGWLRKNHRTSKGIWLGYYKKHTGRGTLTHGEAVEEALCYGWIDSQIRRLDEDRYIQRYTPRKPNSLWSEINKISAIKLIKKGRMTSAGMEKLKEAKRNGRWSSAYRSKRRIPIPEDLKKALQKDRKAWKNFNAFANSYRTMYISWVEDAKRKETRLRRISKVVERSRKNLRAGIDL